MYDTTDAALSDSNIKGCQQIILPGVSITEFIKCVLNKGTKGYSKIPTLQPTVYPPIKSEYSVREYSPLVMTHVNSSGSFNYNFEVEFQQLSSLNLLFFSYKIWNL